MKIVLKGNTSQYTTTGIQCFNKNAINQELSDKVVAIDTGIKLMNIWSGGAFTNEEIVKMFKPSTTYTCRIVERITSRPETITEIQNSLGLYRPASGSLPTVFITLINDRASKQTATLNTDIEYIKTFTTPEDLTNLRLLAYTFMTSTGASGTIELKDFMIVEGEYTSSNFPSYEPYTNGASPNPDYPQDVHIVSGDNEVKVEGKNLFDDSVKNNTWINVDGTISTSATGSNLLKIKCSAGDTYTLSGTFATANGNGVLLIAFFDENNNMLSRTAEGNKTSITKTATAPNNTAYMYVGHYIQEPLTIQLEEGSTATTYEPYQEQKYPINLGVENLIGLVNGTGTQNGITATTSDGEITLNGTATANSFVDIQLVQNYTLINGETYTVSLNNEEANNNVSFRITGSGTYDTIANAVNRTNTITYDSSNAIFGNKITIRTNSGTTLTNFRLKPQIEKGSKVNSYTPYGTTPIELCKIGTYKDGFVRSTGKNLLEPNSFAQKVIDTPYSSANVSTYDSETGELSIKMGNNNAVFDNFKENTRYTIILKYNIATNGSNLQIAYTDNTTQNITPSAGSGIFRLVTTEGKSVASIKHSAYDSTTPRILYLKESGIFEGVIETTDFEPYGNGDWYLKKNTGKMILNGTENWSIQTTWSAVGDKTNAFYITRPTELNPGQACYCDYLKYASNVAAFLSTDEYGVTYSASLILRMPKSLENGAALQNWLASNNMKLYYALLNPTYTKIEGTLESQLNALAKSYNSQTNISQDNNDLASILNATALEEME